MTIPSTFKIPPLYSVIQPSIGETVQKIYADFFKRFGLPPNEIYESHPPRGYKAALHLIYAGPLPMEFSTMPKEAEEILRARIIELLSQHPEGINARDIALQLATEPPYSNTALKALLEQRRVVCDMKPTGEKEGHFRTIYFLAAPAV